MPQTPEDPAYLATKEKQTPLVVEEELSEQQKQERAKTLSELYKEPVSIELQAYFKRLKEGSPVWELETFIEGAKRFANLHGSKSLRIRHYKNTLLGLHYPTSFVEKWNAINYQQPVTVWDLDFGRQCPPSWSSELSDGYVDWVLTYRGEAPLSQGLNELLRGPTTIDCGMFCQLLLWMAIRYLIGDELFDKVFNFKKGGFTLTQGLYEPMNEAGSYGNLLDRFCDDPRRKKTTNFVESTTRIQLRAIFNHPEYPAQHPGGMDNHENVVQIDGYNFVLESVAPQNILSDLELDQSLMQLYNASWDLADLRTLWLWRHIPDFVYSHFYLKDFGTLAREAEEHAGHTLNATEWGNSQAERVKKAEAFCQGREDVRKQARALIINVGVDSRILVVERNAKDFLR
ncbi:hypothetical protein AOQ84DRAFT_431039 [Glonium stellatum]|uniref:Uncharacterized protein n=1 Tax=Glonium stellatum TaxID=574774 RepID=A0A8E2JUU0_9PEZI|nr:hypothetical protein AOQ84DRAFT_431039 [Glonium stellatum]